MATSSAITSIDFILPGISALAAVVSVYFAFKTLRYYKRSQIPVLKPEILDVENPSQVKIKIENVGNGIAKNIKAEVRCIDKEVLFGSDLLPRKYSDFQILTWSFEINFSGGENPLFKDGKLELDYEDYWGNEYSVEAHFKPDATPKRESQGHIDKQFSGFFYK